MSADGANGSSRTHAEVLASIRASGNVVEWGPPAKEIPPFEPDVEDGPSFVVLDADAIFAPLPPPIEVIVGCVRVSSLALLAGFGSGSKTWSGIDACVSVALGEPWLGRFATKKSMTAFVDFESGSYESRRRLQAEAHARGLARVEGVGLVSMPGLYLGDARFLVAMEKLAKTRSLIVIDSLRAASLVDENDSRIRLGLDQLRAIAERTNCAFVVIVHAKKTSGAPSQIDEREILRGSSAIFDSADVVFVSVYKKDDERFDVSQVKARHGKKVEPFIVRLVDERGGVSVRAEDLPENEAKPARSDKWEACLSRVRQVLRQHAGIGRSILRAKVGGNARTVDAAIEHLIELGEAVDLPKVTGTRTDHSYRLVEAQS
jgi:hypothetical protein